MAFFIIGDSDTVLGYRLAGVHGTAVQDEAETRTAFREALGRPGCSVLLITRAAARHLGAEVAAQRRSGRPPFVAVVTEVSASREDGPSLEAMIQGAIGLGTG